MSANKIFLGEQVIKFLKRLERTDKKIAAKIIAELTYLEIHGRIQYSYEKPNSISLFARKNRKKPIYELRIDYSKIWFRFFFIITESEEIVVNEYYYINYVYKKKTNKISIAERKRIIKSFE